MSDHFSSGNVNITVTQSTTSAKHASGSPLNGGCLAATLAVLVVSAGVVVLSIAAASWIGSHASQIIRGLLVVASLLVLVPAVALVARIGRHALTIRRSRRIAAPAPERTPQVASLLSAAHVDAIPARSEPAQRRELPPPTVAVPWHDGEPAGAAWAPEDTTLLDAWSKIRRS